MSLISCPECNKRISDKAETCPNCGFPITNKSIMQDNICDIDGKMIDLSEALNYSLKGEYRKCFISISKRTNLSVKNCLNILNEIKITDFVPETYTIKEYSSEEEKQAAKTIYSMKDDKSKDVNNQTTPTCPRCGSTSITAGARGVNAVWGFIGASKTVNRCANCGYAWKPHR